MSFNVCNRHLSNSVGHKTSDENTEPTVPASMFSNVDNCSLCVLFRNEQIKL